ncbi:MAG TPA: N-acetylmuramoyl-L-alanine amidase [Chitinophagales bacterium]|nr:N-acetylmuramoyl-L-alanine amidase [Chitinophagales bacterium]
MNDSSTFSIQKFGVLIFIFLCGWLMPSVLEARFKPPRTVQTVVIDAGHGGKDNGCSGNAAKEKKIALSIALKLGEYITQNIPGVKVLYTREKDVFVELHERAAFANKNNADLFISIHCNYSPDAPYVHGTETYVMGTGKTEANLEVARRENAVIALETNYKDNYDGFSLDDPASYIIFSLFQNAYMKQSLAFAKFVEDQFKGRAMRHSRGVKQENFLVLYKTNMPSVLIETGFLSNKAEEEYLNSAEGQTLIASAIYRAFKEFKQDMDTKAQNGNKR